MPCRQCRAVAGGAKLDRIFHDIAESPIQSLYARIEPARTKIGKARRTAMIALYSRHRPGNAQHITVRRNPRLDWKLSSVEIDKVTHRPTIGIAQTIDLYELPCIRAAKNALPINSDIKAVAVHLALAGHGKNNSPVECTVLARGI